MSRLYTPREFVAEHFCPLGEMQTWIRRQPDMKTAWTDADPVWRREWSGAGMPGSSRMFARMRLGRVFSGLRPTTMNFWPFWKLTGTPLSRRGTIT